MSNISKYEIDGLSTLYIKPTTASVLNFYLNDGSTRAGYYDIVGNWTFGPPTTGSPTNFTHIFQSTKSTTLQITSPVVNQLSRVLLNSIWGTSTAQSWGIGSNIIGSAGEFEIYDYTRNGIAAKCDIAGAWTLGASNTGGAHTIQGGATSNSWSCYVVSLNTTAGTSYGLRVRAGFNATDACQIWSQQDTANSNSPSNLGVCYGDGHWVFGTGTAPSSVNHIFKGGGGADQRHTIVRAECSDSSSSMAMLTVGVQGLDYAGLIFDRNGAKPYLWLNGAGAVDFDFIVTSNSTFSSPITSQSGAKVVGAFTTAGAWTLGPSSGTTTALINKINGGLTNGSIAALVVNNYYTSGSVDCLRFQLATVNSGGIQTTSGGTPTFYAGGSDARLKENIVDDKTDYLSKVDKIRLRKFSYIADIEHKVVTGVIAQELQESHPELVMEKEGFLTVTMDYTWELIGAIQELNAKIEAQALEIAALKGDK